MVFLPTLDYLPQYGGVARYLEAIKKTFPYEVAISHWQQEGIPSAKEATRRLFREATGYEAIWVSHILPLGTAAFRFKQKKGVPYVIFLHGMDFDLARRTWLKRMITKKIIQSAEMVVANSQALAYEIQNFSGREDVMVVYPPVADEFIQAAKEVEHQPKKKIRLLTVARLVERKGHLKVLEALQYFPEVEYRIVGDGPFKSEIERKIKELKLSSRVSISTKISNEDIPEEYRQADIFVMPTTRTVHDREGFGIVYLEAQLFKLPVIAVDHPGVGEAVIDKGTGFLIVDHPDALRFALKQLIDHPELRQRMGAAGHEFVLGGFTRETQMRKLEVLLK